MNTRLGSLALAALAAVLVVPAAGAMDMDQMSSGRIVSFGLGGGVSVPVSDARDAFKTGFNGQGFVRFNLKMLPIAPRVDFTFSKFNVDDAKLITTGTTGTGQLLAGVANLQYSLIRGGPVRPYIVAGVGAYNFKTELDNVANGSTSDTRFGVNGGAGVVFKLGHTLSAYVEGRLDNVFTDKGVIATDQIQVVPVTFGVVF
jgi:opacity protein-like surface antigen